MSDLAKEIARQLFTDGSGYHWRRIVMTDEKSGGLGWCEQAVADVIDRNLTAPGSVVLTAEQAEMVRGALIQAKGALVLDTMVNRAGRPYGTTTVAMEQLDAALALFDGKEVKDESTSAGS